MLPEVVADSSNDLESIVIYEEENLKNLNNIYIGHMTKQFAGENDLLWIQNNLSVVCDIP